MMSGASSPRSLHNSNSSSCIIRRFPESEFHFATGIYPSLDSTRHRSKVCITHLLHSVGRQRRSVSARAVNQDLLVARNQCLDLRLEIAARKENGARYVS